jgi:hypothetical protein
MNSNTNSMTFEKDIKNLNNNNNSNNNSNGTNIFIKNNNLDFEDF